MTKRPSDSGLWIVPAAPKPPRSAGTTKDASAPLKGAGGGPGAVWLDGNVLTCACPDCGAPISIRLWLMLADCWRCGTSVELTEEQQRLAQELLEKAHPPNAASLPVAPPAPPAIDPPKPRLPAPPVASVVAPPIAPPPISQRKSKLPVAKLVKGPPAPPVVPTAPPVVAESLARLPWGLPDTASPRKSHRWLAGLASVLLAGVALGLWYFSHRLGETDNSAGPVAVAPSPPVEKGPPKPGEELSLSRDATGPTLGELPKVIEAIMSRGQPRMFEGRDPRVRRALLDEEGGSLATEAAVVAGLRWLSMHQERDGHWSLDHFSHAGDCNGRCNGEGGNSDVAATALALLPFLGAGQSHKLGIYQDTVARGLKWLVKQQKPDGDLRGAGMGHMYAHGLATIVLCEAAAMTGDESLRGPAISATEFIIRAQHPAGGWRYEPGQEGDLSVVGWQLMALQSAKMAYIHVPSQAFDRAAHYLSEVRAGRHSGLFGYQRGSAPTPAMTAEGLLCGEYLGWPQDHPGLKEGVDWLLREQLPNKDRPNIYCWYYATQVMHNIGGEPWEKWNAAVRDALLLMQEKSGHPAGSWAPRGGALGGDHDTREGGRIYMTSLSLCTLEVYYRYLPLYRAIDVE
jgi:hypothetical protein